MSNKAEKSGGAKSDDGASGDGSSDDAAAVVWKDEPDDHDYPAAASYLSLLATAENVDATVRAIEAAPVTRHKAKDVLRASGLELLPRDNEHVSKDLEKIEKGKQLSPVLLVRGDFEHGIPAQIADGYHRVCASYHIDENVDIPARVADLPRKG